MVIKINKEYLYQALFEALIMNQWCGVDVDTGDIQKFPDKVQIHVNSFVEDEDFSKFMQSLITGEYMDIYSLRLKDSLKMSGSDIIIHYI
jgi:hypothetical protein